MPYALAIGYLRTTHKGTNYLYLYVFCSTFEFRCSRLLSSCILPSRASSRGAAIIRLETFCCSAHTEYAAGGAMLSGGTVSIWRRCYWFCFKVLPACSRLLDVSLPVVTVSLYFRRSILESRVRYLVSGLSFYIGNSVGWNWVPFYLGNDERWNLGLPLYLGIDFLWNSAFDVLYGNSW